MKRTFLCCVLGFVLLGGAVRSLAQNDGATEKAVAALEQQWLKSQQTNNPELMIPLLAEKFVATGADGKVLNKEQEVTEAKATKYSSMEYEDVKVTVFGNTAIATGGSKATGTGPDGKPVDSHVRWTDSWVKMPNGKWQCVASHVSSIKM
ncbi:MAG: nuclear transport factor 2 family protein [Candidatus Acidiferrum sp.]